MPQQYECVVYSCPSHLDDGEEWLEEHHLPVVEIGRWIAIADSPRNAAARAWVRTVGRARVRKLHELNAPIAIIEHEGDPQQIASELATCDLWIGECFKLDNLAEAWYIVATLG